MSEQQATRELHEAFLGGNGGLEYHDETIRITFSRVTGVVFLNCRLSLVHSALESCALNNSMIIHRHRSELRDCSHVFSTEDAT
jgi:hypothetical protein